MTRLRLLLAAALTSVAAVPAIAQQHTSLALPSITPGFTAIYVAQDKGFWKDQGLDVTVSQIAGVGTINAVIAGSIDFSGSTAGTLIRAAVAGQRMMAIANLTDRPMDEVVLRKDLAIERGFDPSTSLAKRASMVKGLRIAVDAINTINHGFLRYVARKGGLNADQDVTVAPMQSPTMAAALAAKAIDGFSVSQPWTTAVIVDGSAVRLVSVPAGDFPELVPFGGGIIVTRPQFCQQRRDICMKMGHGIVQAAQFMKDHSAETLAIIKPRFGTLDERTLDAALQSYRAATPASLAPTAAILETSQNFELNTGLTKPADALGSFDGMYSGDFVR